MKSLHPNVVQEVCAKMYQFSKNQLTKSLPQKTWLEIIDDNFSSQASKQVGSREEVFRIDT